MGQVEAEQFLEGAVRLASQDHGRRVPSPSSTPRCTRQVWYRAHGYEQDNFPDNGESFISAESGRASEPILSRIAEEAGFGRVIEASEDERELTPWQCERINAEGGQYDRLIETDQGLALAEFKRKGAYDILDLIRKGVIEAQPNEYMQMQLLMHALELPRCLYIAANWDRGMFTRTASMSKAFKGQPRPNGVVVEWIEYNRTVAEAAVWRAGMMKKLIKEVKDGKDVPRDYDPRAGKFPCTWCDFANACKRDG